MRCSDCVARARQNCGGSERGDIRYRFTIDVPETLTDEQRSAVDALAQTMNGNPRQRLFEGVSS